MTRSELTVKMLEDVINRIRDGSIKIDNYSYRDYIDHRDRSSNPNDEQTYHIDIQLDYR